MRGNLSNAQGFGQLDQSSNSAEKRYSLEESIYMNNWADLLVDQRLEEERAQEEAQSIRKEYKDL